MWQTGAGARVGYSYQSAWKGWEAMFVWWIFPGGSRWWHLSCWYLLTVLPDMAKKWLAPLDQGQMQEYGFHSKVLAVDIGTLATILELVWLKSLVAFLYGVPVGPTRIWLGSQGPTLAPSNPSSFCLFSIRCVRSLYFCIGCCPGWEVDRDAITVSPDIPKWSGAECEFG